MDAPRKCIHLHGCTAPAVRLVSPYWLCEEHALAEEAAREIDRARIRQFEIDHADELAAEARAEQALEARVS